MLVILDSYLASVNVTKSSLSNTIRRSADSFFVLVIDHHSNNKSKQEYKMRLLKLDYASYNEIIKDNNADYPW